MSDDSVPKEFQPIERIGCALPYFGQTESFDNTGPFSLTWLSRIYLKDEFQSVLDEYMKVIGDPEAVETFLAERLAISNDRITFGCQISVWIRASAVERRRNATVIASSRREMIFKKLQELGYSDRYFRQTYLDESSWKWRSLINQPRPLTDRVWSTIRPQLEKTIQLRREKIISLNKSNRDMELDHCYAKFQESFSGPNFLPRTILALVPSVATVLAESDYSERLWIGGSQWIRILELLPDIVKRFHRMVVDDYLDVVLWGGSTNFCTNDNWASRFEEEEGQAIWGPTESHISYVRRALSFFDTPQGIFSYDMLEEVGWWAPFSPVPRSVSRIAHMVLAQMQLPSDIGMSHMLSLGNVFLCARCGSTELMSWLELLDHFKYQQKTYEDANTKKQELGLDVPLFDCHSDAETSPPAMRLSASEVQWLNENSISHEPSRCSLCLSLDIDVSLSSQDEVQAHFCSWHHGYVDFDK